MDDSKVSIEKLNENNYVVWKFKMRLLLIQEKVLKIVMEPKPAEPDDTWDSDDEKAQAVIGLALEDCQLIHVMEKKSAKEMWDALREYHERTSLSRIIQVMRQLISLRMLETGNMADHLKEMTVLRLQLTALGEEVQDQWFVALMLASLPRSYDGLIVVLESRSDEELTVDFVKGMLLDEGRRRSETKTASSLEGFDSSKVDGKTIEAEAGGSSRVESMNEGGVANLDNVVHVDSVAGPSQNVCESTSSAQETTNQYQQLLELEQANKPLIHNNEPCNCVLCGEITPAGKGVVLVNCLHTFCIECLRVSLNNNDTVRCPYPAGEYTCEGHVEDREIQVLLSPDEYQEFSKRHMQSLAAKQTNLDLLVALSDASVAPNSEPFECPICFESFEAYKGIILRDCFHCFCRECLINSINHAEDVVVKCPSRQDSDNPCQSVMQEREIRSLLGSEDYEKYSKRSLQKAESLSKDSFHCKTPDCGGWCLAEEGTATVFACPICEAPNCLKCKVIHAEKTCEQYQNQLRANNEIGQSEQTIQEMVTSREAMRCPTCNITVTKISGCNNMQCGMCKNKFQWTGR